MYNSSAELGIYRKPACVLLAAGVFSAAGTFAINHWRYQTFRVAGPFDLAYFNQQQWNLWHGMASLTIRPRISYATEGPEPWRTMRLRPITLLVTLLYPLAPGVPLLLAIQSISIGLGVLPAYLLGRHVASGQRADGIGDLTAVQPLRCGDRLEVFQGQERAVLLHSRLEQADTQGLSVSRRCLHLVYIILR